MKRFLFQEFLFVFLILNLGIAASTSGAFAAQRTPITDDTIVDQVRLRLTSDPVVKGGAIQVDANHGVVTLGGAVETSKQKVRAGQVARKVKGVKKVLNNLVVKSR
jgi:hyperosmotically inducible protein